MPSKSSHPFPAVAAMCTGQPPEPRYEKPAPYVVEEDDHGATVRIRSGAAGADVLLGLLSALAGRPPMRLYQVAPERGGFMIRLVRDVPDDLGPGGPI
ncbi:hypothetical protein [Frankia sp. CcI49]|uniref:hypothetical protein n=1 Tax=Frankia sp. CcI49 TaxID=1745382 RepID=UPI001054F2FB|nr:hypothetical protein [Frankia sp. CcI49]